MRRTTICRSKAAIAFAAAIIGLAAPASARQNPSSQPAQQPAARDTALATPLSQLPATHTVGHGETLWGLAQQFYGDPLLWPEIYRINTDVVEDPHWIFPGEELRIAPPPATEVAQAAPPKADTTQPGQGVTVTPQADTSKVAAPAAPAGPVVTEGPTIFSTVNRQGPVQQNQTIEVRAQQAYRALREGEVYSAPFLSEGKALPTGRLIGTLQPPNVERLTTSTTALLYTDVAFDPPSGQTFKPGDLLLALDRQGALGTWGNVIIPTGLLRVEAAQDSTVAARHGVAQVIALYRSMHDGQEVLPITPFQPMGNAHADEVANGITGSVIGLANPQAIVGVQDELFIDKGAEDSVQLGDVFMISGPDRGRIEMTGSVLEQAEAMVVNVQQKSCTVKIMSIKRPDVRAGSVARLIRRMP